MTDANPPYLDFSWQFVKTQGQRDRIRSNGFISRVNWTPERKSDFGEIKCIASNGLDTGECKIQLVLGGPPNPPHQCYHKENNKTIIIECLPGFDQGDPEVYFYLLKKKSNDILVEYARKRDSCSFLISNLILEEHMNEFFIYSSNKYGNNRPLATKIVIENKEFLAKNSKKLQDLNDQKSNFFLNLFIKIFYFSKCFGLFKDRQLTFITVAVIFGFVLISTFCCMLLKCHNSNIKMKSQAKPDRGTTSAVRNSHFDYSDAYKYSSHQNQYQSKTGIHIDNYQQSKNLYNGKSFNVIFIN